MISEVHGSYFIVREITVSSFRVHIGAFSGVVWQSALKDGIKFTGPQLNLHCNFEASSHHLDNSSFQIFNTALSIEAFSAPRQGSRLLQKGAQTLLHTSHVAKGFLFLLIFCPTSSPLRKQVILCLPLYYKNVEQKGTSKVICKWEGGSQEGICISRADHEAWQKTGKFRSNYPSIKQWIKKDNL